MGLGLGLSNNSVGVSANVNFFSRVLGSFTARNEFKLRISMGNSLCISRRRAIRSANVILNGTFTRTLLAGRSVREFNDFCIPVSRTLTFTSISVDNEPCLMFSTSFPRREYNNCSYSVAMRFVHTFTFGTRVALRLGSICNSGSRRVARTLCGTYTRTLHLTMGRGSSGMLLSAGKILW